MQHIARSGADLDEDAGVLGGQDAMVGEELRVSDGRIVRFAGRAGAGHDVAHGVISTSDGRDDGVVHGRTSTIGRQTGQERRRERGRTPVRPLEGESRARTR